MLRFLAVMLLAPAAAAEPLHLEIGALLPLTGPLADEGIAVRRGLELAVAELGGGAKVVLRVEDTQGDTKAAVDAFTRLRAGSKIPIVITWGSGIGLALMPLVEREGVLQFSIAASTPHYTRRDDLSVRLFPSASAEGAFLGKHAARTVGRKRFGIVFVNNDYGAGLAESFKNRVRESGGQAVAAEPIAPVERDFGGVLLRLKRQGAEAIYLACYAGCAINIAAQRLQMGWDVPILASSASVAAERFAETIGSAGEGLYLVLAGPDYQHPGEARVQQFVKLYTENYQERPGPMLILSARAFDAVTLIAETASRCGDGKDAHCLRDRVLKVKDYDGASGRISFDAAGDSLGCFGLYRLARGNYTLVAGPECY